MVECMKVKIRALHGIVGVMVDLEHRCTDASCRGVQNHKIHVDGVLFVKKSSSSALPLQ